MTVPSPSPGRSLRRLWQPRRGLFWLMISFNVLSSVLTGLIHLTDPPLILRWVLSLMALSNAVMGWWLLARLWRETPAEPVQPRR